MFPGECIYQMIKTKSAELIGTEDEINIWLDSKNCQAYDACSKTYKVKIGTDTIS